ncbi:phosphoribosylformylglycinamidine synthase subunit PurS [Chrysiogenes arsenatis]|uniref:phosphoribosylformylglycinamidine synthase subunit PurS n=1 Tax=Chrysiogenes arsenatis TaxID=309797 RepID=UPI000414E7C0|nr:phosphoribosylformylglycinamidine synthase subunit PurS [Chrysiogenes arsenatis]
MLAKVYVTLKNGVLDPQGKAILGSLHAMDFQSARDVRVGKYLEIEVNGTDPELVRSEVAEMAKKLLANTVIENYRIELVNG